MRRDIVALPSSPVSPLSTVCRCQGSGRGHHCVCEQVLCFTTQKKRTGSVEGMVGSGAIDKPVVCVNYSKVQSSLQSQWICSKMKYEQSLTFPLTPPLFISISFFLCSSYCFPCVLNDATLRTHFCLHLFRGPVAIRLPQHRHGSPAEGGGADKDSHHAVRCQRHP